MSHSIRPVNPFTAVARELDEFPASIAQLKFVVSLLGERAWESMENPKYVARCAELTEKIPAFVDSAELDDSQDVIVYERDCPMTKSGASKLIEGLQTLPRKAVVEVKADVPAGHYAIDWDHMGLRFFRVDRPTEGKWAGYVFVKGIVGPEEHRVSREVSNRVLAEIAKDAKAAAVRYGKEIGRCSICNRRLTNEESREAGIGPQCAAKF